MAAANTVVEKVKEGPSLRKAAAVVGTLLFEAGVKNVSEFKS